MIEIRTKKAENIVDILKIINENNEGFSSKINELEKRIEKLERPFWSRRL